MTAKGHAQYLEFLRVAGECFSPMFPLAEPLRRGEREFWCVEGLWQGTKVVRLTDLARVADAGVEFEVIRKEEGSALVWFPAAGLVRQGFKHSLFFDVLKSGHSHNAARNRWFGQGNWAFVGHYLPDDAKVIADRDLALRLIHHPAYRGQLAQHQTEISLLRDLLAQGAVRITAEMRETHPHLNLVLEALSAVTPAIGPKQSS